MSCTWLVGGGCPPYVCPSGPPTSPSKEPTPHRLHEVPLWPNQDAQSQRGERWDQAMKWFSTAFFGNTIRSFSEVPLRTWQPVATSPRGGGGFSTQHPLTPRHRLSAPAAMFNSSRLHFRKHNIYTRPKTMAEEKLANHSESHLPPVKFYSFCRSPWKNPTKESLQVLGSFTKSDPQAVNCRPQTCQCLLLCELSRVAIKSSLRWDNTDNYLHIVRISEAN